MPGPNSTSLLVGRDREVASLVSALEETLKGYPQTVLVTGDAGIGKTSLVATVAQRAIELGFTVAVGHCLDLEADISFAPAVEAVRVLVSAADDVDSRPATRRVRELLDQGVASGAGPVRALQDLSQAVLEAASAGPVMLVLEDLHWADRSTRDFAAALSRTGRGRLILVLTVRDEDLHRRHPARRTLAEMSRVPGARRIDVPPLDRDGITRIATATSGGAPAPALVRAVMARSEGNPLYAEELLAPGARSVPGHLADLFLARVDALSDGPRALLRIASVDGTQVDTDTLKELARVDQTHMDLYLHELLDANLLQGGRGHLAFRHGLLREAVYDDLLPDERTQLHADLAAILQAQVEADPAPGLSVLSRVAFHWSAAHDLPRTLQASVRAGTAAARVGAAEAVSHFERALSFWDRLPDAEPLSGLTKVELVLMLARAVSGQGDAERWHSLSRRAADMLEPGTDRLVASRVYTELAVSAMHDHDLLSAPDAIQRAIDRAGAAPTAERARAFAAQALLHNFEGRYAAGLDAADRAIGDATATASIDPLLWGLTFRSEALAYLGLTHEAPLAAEEALEQARRAGMTGHALHAAGWLAAMLMDLGQVGRGEATARAAYDEAAASGLPVEAAWCAEVVANALIWQGRLDAAEQILAEVCALGPPEAPWRGQADLFLARGEVAMAAQVTPAKAMSDPAVGAYPDHVDVLRELQIAAMRDDGPRCLAVADGYLGLLEDGDSPLIAAAAARIGFQALALNPAVPERGTERLRELAFRLLARARAGLTEEWRRTYHRVQLGLAEAYAAGVAGESTVAHFREAAALAEPFGPYFALEPRLELARALLADGARGEGRELLVDSWTEAHDMCAHGLEQRAIRLATRTRVPLPESASREGPLSRLTPREREVLDLLATGTTNKAIAGTLFISEKTVSTHVSSLLTKLGVANRGGAVALARRLVG